MRFVIQAQATNNTLFVKSMGDATATLVSDPSQAKIFDTEADNMRTLASFASHHFPRLVFRAEPTAPQITEDAFRQGLALVDETVLNDFSEPLIATFGNHGAVGALIVSSNQALQLLPACHNDDVLADYHNKLRTIVKRTIQDAQSKRYMARKIELVRRTRMAYTRAYTAATKH